MRALVAAALVVAAPVPGLQTGWADAPSASPRGLDGFVSVDRLPEPADARLAEGRAIWGENCENCHGGNKAVGAPKITSIRAWAPRIDKGLDMLVRHAIDGFIGPRFTQMPPRGANPDLTDAEVALAASFMVWASGGESEALAYIASAPVAPP